MDFDEMTSALREAEETQRVADRQAERAARIAVGRLRHCSDFTLKALKRELRDFNIHTGVWKK